MIILPMVWMKGKRKITTLQYYGKDERKYNDLLDPVDGSIEAQDAHLEESFHDKPENKDGDNEGDVIE